jgi:hypothetical protein
LAVDAFNLIGRVICDGRDDKAAWQIKHRIMQAMAEREASCQLAGLVLIDGACLGGERDGGKPDRGSESKQVLLIAVETDVGSERPARAVIQPMRGFYMERHLTEGACRFNRRLRLREMLPLLARALMACTPHSEPARRMASNFHG